MTDTRHPPIFILRFFVMRKMLGMKYQKESMVKPLPWWTWILPFFIFHLGTLISLYFRVPSGTALFYLPIPLGIILIHWWGPRILPGLFLNSFITALIWDASDFRLWPLMTTHECICVFVSWYLFSYKFKGKAWLPDIRNAGYFLILGILIPITINAIYIFLLSSHEDLVVHTAMVWTSDFASSFSLALPCLYFLTPAMEASDLTLDNDSRYIPATVSYRVLLPHVPEIIVSVIGLSFFSFVLPLEKYWFVYGIFTLYLSVRFGFDNAILANLLIFILTYIIPFLISGVRDLSWALESNLINVHLGMCMLSVTACITGRVISDLKDTEQKLNKQFLELERAHKELDRFVYSASHDLSAPLKSMLGLVHVSRIEKDPQRHMDYIDRMETSIRKLESFITEVLDYSKNSRAEVAPDLVKISDVVDETMHNLALMDNFHRIEMSRSLAVDEIRVDRMRLKIIMNNLLSNAVKYNCYYADHRPQIAVRSELNGKYIKIQVSDNGQGVHPEAIDKIFTMFYRGTTASNGSGLGLYIAREAAQKMNGKIEMTSRYGEGSTFTVYVPILS